MVSMISPLNTIELPRYACQRCGHVWYPRRPEQPTICPNCKSRLWQTARSEQGIERRVRQYECSQIVRSAVRSGELVKPGVCPSCGSDVVQGHHDDYSKPLDVRWVCPVCHAAIRFGESRIQALCPECGQRMVRAGRVKVGENIKQQWKCTNDACGRRTLNPQEDVHATTTIAIEQNA